MTRKEMQKSCKCYFCGGKAETLDHYIPRSRGGRGLGKTNLVPACISCNQEKRDMLPEEYRVFRAARHLLATQGIMPVANMLSLVPDYRFYGEEHDMGGYLMGTEHPNYIHFLENSIGWDQLIAEEGM